MKFAQAGRVREVPPAKTQAVLVLRLQAAAMQQARRTGAELGDCWETLLDGLEVIGTDWDEALPGRMELTAEAHWPAGEQTRPEGQSSPALQLTLLRQAGQQHE